MYNPHPVLVISVDDTERNHGPLAPAHARRHQRLVGRYTQASISFTLGLGALRFLAHVRAHLQAHGEASGRYTVNDEGRLPKPSKYCFVKAKLLSLRSRPVCFGLLIPTKKYKAMGT